MPNITGKNYRAILRAYRPPNKGNIYKFIHDLSHISNKNLEIFNNIFMMGDFNIDFKNKNDCNFEKLNNFLYSF